VPSLPLMASLPPEPILSAPVAPASDAALAAQWELVHARAAALCSLAQIAPEAAPEPLAPLLGSARDWQRNLAAQGLGDIEAMLSAGLSALAALSARGQETHAPALALWREFHSARASVLAALQPLEVA